MRNAAPVRDLVLLFVGDRADTQRGRRGPPALLSGGYSAGHEITQDPQTQSPHTRSTESVTGEICPQCAHDQEVHRVPHRQAVHREDQRGHRRVQLRSVGGSGIQTV